VYKLGHEHGPISSEMNKTLKECDDYVSKLLQMIDNDDYLKTNLNVIITSDHGMHEIKKNHTIKLEHYIDTSLFSAYGSRSFVNIFVHSNRKSDIDRIYTNLSHIPNYEVYKKSQIPNEYHYQSNVRIGGKFSLKFMIFNDCLLNLIRYFIHWKSWL
jgi:predicted AlkP superfamily pyrophosphatase or phosphodiesterase